MPFPARCSTSSTVWILAAAAVVAGLGGFFVAPQGYLLLASLLLVLAIGTLWPWITIWGVTSELEFETPRGREFEPTIVRMTISNRWPWPAWGLVVDCGTPRSGDPLATSPLLAIPSLPGASRTVLRWEFIPARRGIHPQHAWRLGTAFPIGLYLAQRTIRTRESLVVWPAVTRLKSLPPTLIGQPHGEALHSITGDHGETCGVRPYRHGDTLRTIHWQATARSADLMVREFRTTVSSLLNVELIWPTIQPDDANSSSHETDTRFAGNQFDIAVRLTASLCAEAVQQGHVAVCSIDQSTKTAGAQPGDLRPLMDWLAVVTPTSTRFSASSATQPGKNLRPGNRIVITPADRQNATLGRPLPLSALLDNPQALLHPTAAHATPPLSGELDEIGIAVALTDRPGRPSATRQPPFPRPADLTSPTAQHLDQDHRSERRIHAIA